MDNFVLNPDSPSHLCPVHIKHVTINSQRCSKAYELNLLGSIFADLTNHKFKAFGGRFFTCSKHVQTFSFHFPEGHSITVYKTFSL